MIDFSGGCDIDHVTNNIEYVCGCQNDDTGLFSNYGDSDITCDLTETYRCYSFSDIDKDADDVTCSVLGGIYYSMDIDCMETDCNDDKDDDRDSKVDCVDLDCDEVDNCEYETEVTCDDNFDNDQDDYVDCEDSDCSFDSACEVAGTEEECSESNPCDDGYTCEEGVCVDCGWNIETVDSDGYIGMSSSLAFDNYGNPSIAYFDSTNYDLKYAYYDGSSWSTEIVDSAGDVGSDVSLAFDNLGNIGISYYDSTNDNLKYAYYDGSSWSTEIVDSAGDVGKYTSLSFDASSNSGIAYYDVTNGDLNYAYYDGSSWSVEIIDNTGGNDPSLVFDSSGNPRIAYYDYTNDNLNYAYYDGSSWSIEIIDSAGDVGSHISLDLDNSGNLGISYYDYTNGNLKYAYYGGSSWSIEIVDSDGEVGRYNSLAFDESNNPVIAYYDGGANSNLKYAYYGGSSWSIEIVDTKGGRDISLAFDESNNPAIAYSDSINSDLKYSHFVSCEETTTKNYEICDDSIDNDGDGLIDYRSGCDTDADGLIDYVCGTYDTAQNHNKGYTSYGEVDSTGACDENWYNLEDNSYRDRTVLCGIDEDLDGSVINKDDECSGALECSVDEDCEDGYKCVSFICEIAETCDDSIDNDGDSKTDTEDSDCYECASDSECGDNQYCSSYECVDKTSCNVDLYCKPYACEKSFGYCYLECNSNSECASGFGCSNGECVAEEDIDCGCEDGYYCTETGGECTATKCNDGKDNDNDGTIDYVDGIVFSGELYDDEVSYISCNDDYITFIDNYFDWVIIDHGGVVYSIEELKQFDEDMIRCQNYIDNTFSTCLVEGYECDCYSLAVSATNSVCGDYFKMSADLEDADSYCDGDINANAEKEFKTATSKTKLGAAEVEQNIFRRILNFVIESNPVIDLFIINTPLLCGGVRN
ncbi:hypothetical protein J4467_02710 [Candidatus Woesearchaeota archaeon]|nr:hypothetical protein [Candidatus Woesearchaeota archaeon]